MHFCVSFSLAKTSPSSTHAPPPCTPASSCSSLQLLPPPCTCTYSAAKSPPAPLVSPSPVPWSSTQNAPFSPSISTATAMFLPVVRTVSSTATNALLTATGLCIGFTARSSVFQVLAKFSVCTSGSGLNAWFVISVSVGFSIRLIPFEVSFSSNSSWFSSFWATQTAPSFAPRSRPVSESAPPSPCCQFLVFALPSLTLPSSCTNPRSSSPSPQSSSCSNQSPLKNCSAHCLSGPSSGFKASH